MTTFSEELRSLINRYSRENESNTPDFILAEYIESSLNAFEAATKKRDEWYGIAPKPGKTYVLEETPWIPGSPSLVNLREILPTSPDEKQAPELVEGTSSTIPAPESIPPVPLPAVPEIPKFFRECMDHHDDEGSIG